MTDQEADQRHQGLEEAEGQPAAAQTVEQP
jgi:hypothetical protein